VDLNPITLIDALRNTDIIYIEKIYLNGGCYQFYKFLRVIYPDAEPYFIQTKDHIVTKIGNSYYDITGEVKGQFIPLTIHDMAMCEGWSFWKRNWLYRECPNCGEQIMA